MLSLKNKTQTSAESNGLVSSLKEELSQKSLENIPESNLWLLVLLDWRLTEFLFPSLYRAKQDRFFSSHSVLLKQAPCHQLQHPSQSTDPRLQLKTVIKKEKKKKRK